MTGVFWQHKASFRTVEIHIVRVVLSDFFHVVSRLGEGDLLDKVIE